MDNLRWILLLSGILLIVGIFTWEVFRRRHSEWDDSADSANQSFETEGDGLFAEPTPKVQAQSHDTVNATSSISQQDNGVVVGDLAGINTQAPAAKAVPPKKGSVTGKPVVSGDATTERQQSDESLICAIAVTAKPGHRFSGGRICEALETLGMRYGQMGIFHYYRSGEHEDCQPVFSAANMLEPGSFDLEAIDSLYTPGLMLFMKLPGEMEGTEIFDLMLATGKQLAERLGGELRDETRSSLTPQSIGHMREQIIDFARKRRLTLP